MAKYIALYNNTPYVPIYAGGESYTAVIEYFINPVEITITITKDGSALANTAIQVDGKSYTTNASGKFTMTGDSGETKKHKFYQNDNCWAYKDITYTANGTVTVDISTRYALCIYRGKKETLYSSSWTEQRPPYEVYINNELQTSFDLMEVVNSSGIHYYEIYLVPKGATVLYQSVYDFQYDNIEIWQARCTHSGNVTHSSATSSSYQFTMGANDVTINDLSYSGITVTIDMVNSPFCKFTYINTSGVSVTTGTVSSNTSYTIQANTTFTIINDKTAYHNLIYQDGTFKAEADGSWTSANLSSNTTFRIESEPMSSGE